jgi:electron transfer flavoprotein beta subunit
MKKVVVCYKWLLDTADLRADGSGKLDLERAKWTLNEYDRNGIEAGVWLKNATGCELIGVTCGPRVQASCKDALSRGLDSVTYVEHEGLHQADSGATAKILSRIVRHLGEVDVVICSEGSSDEYAQQTGGRLAALLGYASVSYVSALDLKGSDLVLDRKLEDGVEKVQVPCPVVLSVSPDVNEVPIPSVKQILGAKKKPSSAASLDAIGLCDADCLPVLRTKSVQVPKVDRKLVRLNPEGTPLKEAAAELVKRLAADCLL